MASKEKVDPRFRYIGFEVHPGKAKPFWKSEEERKEYEKRIREQEGSRQVEKAFSFVHVEMVSAVDRFFLTLGNLVLIASLFLPWFRFTYGESAASFSGLGVLANLGFVGSLASWSGIAAQLEVIVLSVLIVLAPLVGILNLVTLHVGRGGEDKYLRGVKNSSRLFFLLMLLWLLVLVLAALGFAMPFGNLGIPQIGMESFNLLSFLTTASVGFYLTFAASWLNSTMALFL
jgi:hypothetical protein